MCVLQSARQEVVETDAKVRTAARAPTGPLELEKEDLGKPRKTGIGGETETAEAIDVGKFLSAAGAETRRGMKPLHVGVTGIGNILEIEKASVSGAVETAVEKIEREGGTELEREARNERET